MRWTKIFGNILKHTKQINPAWFLHKISVCWNSTLFYFTTFIFMYLHLDLMHTSEASPFCLKPLIFPVNRSIRLWQAGVGFFRSGQHKQFWWWEKMESRSEPLQTLATASKTVWNEEESCHMWNILHGRTKPFTTVGRYSKAVFLCVHVFCCYSSYQPAQWMLVHHLLLPIGQLWEADFPILFVIWV